MKDTITISQQELLTILNDVEKSTFVNLVIETEVRMRKTNNPYFGRVIKRSKCNYLIGNEYESRVQSNEVKEGMEGTFQSEPPKGKQLSPSTTPSGTSKTASSPPFSSPHL